MILIQNSDNVIQSAFTLLRMMHIRVTHTTLKEKLATHPDYPSLNAVSEVFRYFKINNLAVQISAEELPEIPTPCLAALNEEGGVFAVVNSVKDGFVEWLDTQRGKQRDSIASFSEKWQGVLLLVEVTETSGEANFLKKRHKEIFSFYAQLSLWFTSIIVFTAVFYLFWDSTIFTKSLIPIFITKFSGIIINSLLLWYLIDKQNPLLKNICQVGKSANCNSVLNSKVATIGGVLSWSEIGFFYFTGSFLALLFGFQYGNIIIFLALTNLLALPYTLFSIYYQSVILKKWCILCLSVQVLLWIEFSMFYFLTNYISFLTVPNLREILVLLISFSLPVLIWFSLKPTIQLASQTDILEKRLKKIQDDKVIFQHILTKQQPMLVIIPNMDTIILGNPDAENVITFVTNPYCNACAKKHYLIQEIIEQNIETVKCQLVFAVEKNDEGSKFVQHLFSLHQAKQIEALDFWFNMPEKDFKKWSTHFSIAKIDERSLQNLKLHQLWSYKSMIQTTPTIFINGFQLPDVYQIEDIQRIAYRIFTEPKNSVA